jgi:hypothetical protein
MLNQAEFLKQIIFALYLLIFDFQKYDLRLINHFANAFIIIISEKNYFKLLSC